MAIPNRWKNFRLDFPNPRRTTRARLGANAEKIARRHLERNDLRLVRPNYRCRFGEIDLIMLDRDCLVFIEVRCRSSSQFTSPALTVDEQKQRKIARTAMLFLSRRPRFSEHPVRFDVVAIEGTDQGRSAIQWIKDAFRV